MCKRESRRWSGRCPQWLVGLALCIVLDAHGFQHPGIPLTLTDLNSLRTNLYNWPWSDGYSALSSDSRSQVSYAMQGPFGYVNRNNAGNYDHEAQWKNDMQAIFNLSRMWYFTSNTAYAQKARDILIAWANTMTNFGGIEAGLDLGDYAYRYGGGADILRGTWPGWTTADTLAVSNFFAKVYEPATMTSSTRTLGPSNKGALSMSGALACAVFNDDTNLFNQVLYLYRTSASCGLHNNCLTSGEMGETGRDQGHSYDDLLQMAFIAEIFWKQGVDIYSEDDNRLLACGEYYARNNLPPAAAYITYGTSDEIYWNNSTNAGGSSAGGAYTSEPMMGNILRGAYVARKGLSAPWMVIRRFATPAANGVAGSQGENEDSFCYLKSLDASTAIAPAPVIYPAAPTVTSGLNNVDIGGVGVAGSGSYSGGSWAVTGGGAEVWTHSSDSCHFVYRQVSGDCAIIARVNSVQNTAATAKAGVMIRDSLSSSAANRAWVAITPSSTFESYNNGWTECYGGSNWETRPRNGQGWEYIPSMPYWVKLERKGNTISTYVSLDGASWATGTVAVYDNMPSTTYLGIFVCALNTGAANSSSFSNVSITGGDGGNLTVPPAPYAAYASPDAGRVPLRWLQSFGATGYIVLRATVSGGPYTTIASVTNASYLDTNVAANTTYYYVIAATNSIGASGYSPQDSATTAASPPAPAGLAVWTGDKLLRVGWAASSSATSYNIWRATGSGGPYTLAGNSTLTSFLDSGLSDGTVYYYVITAINGAGESAYSSETNGTPSAQTAISVNFQGGGANNGTPSLMTAGECAGWVILSNWNNAGSSSTSGSQGALIQNDGLTTTASVTWSCNNLWSTAISDAPGDYRMMKGYLDSAGTSVSTVSISGLPANYSANGYSVYVYFDGDNSADRTAYYTIGNTTITATDAAGVNYAGKYVLANNSAGNCVVFNNLSGGGFTLSATGNAADGTSARAPINGIQVVALMAAAVTNAPGAPAGLSAAPGNGQVTLTWNAAVGAASYNVRYSTVRGGGYVTITNLASTSFVSTGLVNGTTYYFVVSAINSFGESSNSAEVSATPSSSLGVNVTWSGTVNGTWDTSTLNWLNGAAATTFQDGNTAVFDDSASANTVVSISPSSRTPGFVMVTNSLKSYSLGGSGISGSCSLTKLGTGTLTLSGANSFSGGVTLSNGAIIYQNANAFGSGALTLAGGVLAKSAAAIIVTNAINITGTVNYVATGGGDPVFRGAVLGNGVFAMPNAAMGGVTPQAASLKIEGNLAAFTGAFSHTATTSFSGGNRLRFGYSGVGVTNVLINCAQARFVTSGSTAASGANPIDLADDNYGTMRMGELSGGGGILRAGWATNGNTVFEIGALNTSTVYAGAIQDNARTNGAAIGGFTGLTKVGAGTLTLSGPCSYSAQTTVSNGELVVSTAFASRGSVAIFNGAALGFTNTGSGSAVFSNLTVSAGATLEFLRVASTSTPLNAVSNVMVNGACTVRITGTNGLAAGSTYPLISYSGSLSGAFANLQLQMPAGLAGLLLSNAHQIALTVPQAPTGLAVVASDGRTVVTWNASTGASGYNLKRSDDGGITYSEVGALAATNFIDGDLNDGSVYYYKVAGIYAGNSTGDSPPVSARPVSLSRPQISATPGDRQLQLAWPQDHTGWRLQAQTNTLNCGLGTNWVDMPAALATNQISIPIVPPNGSVFYRLVSP